MDKFGFYTERRFQIKHIAASSSFAEWYGLECALNMIRTQEIDITGEKEINIYTDCQSIVDVMANRKGLHSKNELLHNYISKITVLYSTIPHGRGREYKFHHIKDHTHKEQIAKLHKRAHEKAQNPKKKRKGLPEHVYLQVKLETATKGHRKWTIYENHEPMFTGKLRTVLNKYEKERHDIKTLSNQKRLKTDKGTKRVLKKYIGSV